MRHAVLFRSHNFKTDNFIITRSVNRDGIIRRIRIVPMPFLLPLQITQKTKIFLRAILPSKPIIFYR